MGCQWDVCLCTVISLLKTNRLMYYIVLFLLSIGSSAETTAVRAIKIMAFMFDLIEFLFLINKVYVYL